jgi:hypothetical protein
MEHGFTNRERIRRLIAYARRARAEGRHDEARTFVRMARDLRPAPASRRPFA